MPGKTVVHVADYGGPYSGSFIAALCALDKALQSVGWRQVLVFSDIVRDRDWLNQLSASGVPIYLLDSNRNPFCLAWKIDRIVARERAAIVHTHFNTFDVPAWLARHMPGSYSSQSSLVWHVRSIWNTPATIRRRFKDYVKLRVMARDVTVLPVSHGVLADLNSRGLVARRVQVVHNGIDPTRVRSALNRRRPLRHELGISDGALVSLIFAWEPVTKGLDIALEAYELLTNRRDDLVLLVVGRGQTLDFLKRRYIDRFPPWLIVQQPRENVAEFYAIADVFISTSRSEGFSFGLAEAMAAGLPAVASDIPGVGWARESAGVKMFELCSPEALAGIINELANAPPDYHESLGVENSRFVTKRLALDVWSCTILDIYRCIVDGGS